MWDELAIAPTNDPKAIRRAYAARLKTLDPDRDLQAFTRLRTALESALAGVEHASLSSATHARVVTDADNEVTDTSDRPIEAETRNLPSGDARPTADQPAGTTGEGADWITATAADHALLDE